MTSTNAAPEDIRAALGLDRAQRAKTIRRRWLVWAVIIVLLTVGVVAAVRSGSRAPGIQYRAQTVKLGTLAVTVTATGELASLTQVKVGTEISGVVEQVTVDFNSPVEVGQVLARVNTDKLRAQAQESHGALAAAQSKLLQAEATVFETRNELVRLQHVRELSGGRVPSQHEWDAQEAAVKRAEADRASAAAQVMQADASVAAIGTDLKKALIRSPIKGIVLDRQVDQGQTVAASFQTPTLFTLAEDLTRMKLSIDVDEADVGNVRVGQEATFRVAAYPDRSFASRVTEVRSTPKTSNSVVTYETILTVDNSERLLRPGMTATAEITVMTLADAVLVPNAALRFVLPQQAQAQLGQESGGRGIMSFLPRPPLPVRRTAEAITPSEGAKRVFVLNEGQPTPVAISTGPTDGKWTAVVSGDLKPGDEAIVDAAAK